MKVYILPQLIPNVTHMNKNTDMHLNKFITGFLRNSNKYPEKISKYQVCKTKQNKTIHYKKDMVETPLNEVWTLYVNIDPEETCKIQFVNDEMYTLEYGTGILISQLDDDYNPDNSSKHIVKNECNLLIKKLY